MVRANDAGCPEKYLPVSNGELSLIRKDLLLEKVVDACFYHFVKHFQFSSFRLRQQMMIRPCLLAYFFEELEIR